jgi:hypothetical protein
MAACFEEAKGTRICLDYEALGRRSGDAEPKALTQYANRTRTWWKRGTSTRREILQNWS